ncbi:MAG TPA: DUF2339 domain-containing protein [Flavobacterium sp.]|jgi:uncharacterized membrane protein
MDIVLLVLLIVLIFYFKLDLNNKFANLNERIRELSRALEASRHTETFEKPIEKPAPSPVKPVPPPVSPSFTEPVEKPPVVAQRVFEGHQQPTPAPIRPAPKPYVPEKSWWADFKEKNPDLEKFIGENLINKIGVLILVLGISYFVKFAIDKDWINETARAGIGILCGALVMGFAHKLRRKYAAFSSVLVAGAVSIFYFTIGISFHDYHLFNQTVAFILMVVITAFSCIISLSYDRKELAILSLIGGFAVPFMVSTGEGNFVVLFSYITILDIGILALAYSRKWNIVTILAYLFTVILYGSWLYQVIWTAAPPYGGALAFAFVFYLIFTMIVIINNVRTKGEFSMIELSMLASNTFLFYAAGMIILKNYHPEFKGAFTAALALLNLIYAYFLYKRFGIDKKAVYLLIGLTLTFITLAIPVQFKGNYITLFWSVEAVLLMWLAIKSKFESYKLGSIIVHALALISLIMDWLNIYLGDDILKILINPGFITGIFTVASFVAVYKLLTSDDEGPLLLGIKFKPSAYRRYLLVMAIVAGYFTGILEVGHQAHQLIAQSASANSFPALFHLAYWALLVFFLQKYSPKNSPTIAVIAALNVILFAFFFSMFAFNENREYLETNILQRIGFYVHYISLAITLYFGYVIYRSNQSANVFSQPIFIWIGAFLTVYIASSELMLHALIFSSSPVTAAEVQAFPYKALGQSHVISSLASEHIDAIKSQIIKSGFPVLWGVLAFLFLLIGIKKQNKTLRIAALTLLGVTIAKLFLYDIRNASETGKIIAFILLGVLILVISFVYQKIKVLVLEDKKPTDEDS